MDRQLHGIECHSLCGSESDLKKLGVEGARAPYSQFPTACDANGCAEFSKCAKIVLSWSTCECWSK